MTLYTDIEPFCCAVLASRVADGSLPDGDVVMADIHDLGAANLAGYAHIHLFCGIGGMPLGLAWSGWPADRSVLTGGFPCQDISSAGKGAGLDGAKSGLFWELLRILKELNADGEGPESVLLENVGALSRRGLDVVAAALGEAGYVVPESYRVGAWAVGAPHERERWWIVGWRVGASVSNPGVTRAGDSTGENRGQEREPANKPEPEVVRQAHGEAGSGRTDPADRNIEVGDAAQPDSGGTRREAGRREQGNQGRAWSRGYQPRPGDWRRNTRTVPITDNGVVVGHETKADEWFWAGPPILVHAAGRERRIDEPWRGSQGRAAPGRPDPTTERGWPVPVLPGYVQHEWELPRLYQRGVGDAVHGLPGRVAAARNRAGIMALGNAVVPQVVKAVAAGMREAMA